MKVGTDAVLLGAWTRLPMAEKGAESLEVLEIGCGCGIISLMLAQRLQQGAAQQNFGITAIDIHESSCQEALENAQKSPWNKHISIQHINFLKLDAQARFSLVVSNPPFFAESLKSPDAARNLARHNDTLPFGDLLQKSQQVLCQGGILSLVLPPLAFEKICALQAEAAPLLALNRITRVYSKAGKPCGRLLCEWQKTATVQRLQVQESQLFIYDAQGGYDAEYRRMVKDFYLWA